MVAGLTYAVGSVARAVFEAPSTALFLTGIGIILILIFGLFDWTYYDDVIRIALVLIGWVLSRRRDRLVHGGQVGPRFLSSGPTVHRYGSLSADGHQLAGLVGYARAPI